MTRALPFVLLAAVAACSPRPADDASQQIAAAPPPVTAAPTAVASAAPSAAPVETAAPRVSFPPPSPPASCTRDNASVCVAAGPGLERNGDFTGAASLYEKACDAGDGEGCFRLAAFAGDGTAMPRDDRRELALLQKGCDLGDGFSCNRVGGYFGSGIHVERDKAKAEAAEQRAIPLLDAACKAGRAEACMRLAEMIRDGRGTTRDRAREADAFRRAADAYAALCEAGDGDACFWIGSARRFGRGADRDASLALALFDKGCRLGSAMSCDQLGAACSGEELGPKDPARARAAFLQAGELHEKACEGGALESCARAALVWSVHASDAERLAAVERKTCDKGSPHACQRLARKSPPAAAKPLFARAFELWKRGCEAGNGNDCGFLGIAYATGEGVKADGKKGYEALERGCTLADAGACLNLADALASGDHGARKDPAKAKTFYEKACALGRSMACQKAK